MGIPFYVSAYVGVDLPKVPADITVKEEDGRVTLEWKAPDSGVNGAYLNPGELTYTIVRNDNKVISQNLRDTRIEDPDVFSGRQRFIQYAVAASSSAGTGAYGYSEAIVVGTPYTVPFSETFPGGGLDNSFWEGRGSFTLSSNPGSDDTSGCASSKSKAGVAESSLVSGNIALAGAGTAALSYWLLADPGRNAVLTVSILKSDGSVKEIDRLDYSGLTGGKTWRRRMVSLTEFIECAYIRVCLTVTSSETGVATRIDTIEIDESPEKDIHVGISLDRYMRAGEEKTVTATVSNLGYESVGENDYEVELLKDGKVVDTCPGVALDPYGSQEMELALAAGIFDGGSIKVCARAELSNDSNPTNNVSDMKSVSVRHSSLPSPRVLTGEKLSDGNVHLCWEEPDLGNLGAVNTADGAEDYEPFIVDGIGEWSVFDGDGELTFGISDGAGGYRAYPNALDPKAFIVFNASEAGLDNVDTFGNPAKWGAHSGNQMFVSFQASGSANDDWLISPRLSGKAQTVKFWCKSVDASSYGSEEYELLYSNGSTDPDDFVTISYDDAVPSEWTEVEAELPEGAAYFAIRCVSNGHFALFVDDITFSVEDNTDARFNGYNVFRDREKLNDKPVAAEEYSEEIRRETSAYQVCAVYDAGLSLPTEELIVIGSGVENAYVDEEFRLWSESGLIRIEGAYGLEGHIYTIGGAIVCSISRLENSVSVPLTPGTHVVTVGRTAAKIIVR